LLTPAAIVEWGNHLALIGWAVLIVMPRRWRVLSIVPRTVIPTVFGLIYSGLMLAFFARADGGYDSLADIKMLFMSDEILAAGWLHYLAFDLFVGAWIAERADDIELPRIIQTIILTLTFLFGPMGLVLFFITKRLMKYADKIRIKS
jgi:Domain of unknown function (DUF4281)